MTRVKEQVRSKLLPSNIAEGSSRTSQKDHCRFIEIALGSLFELETQVLIAKGAGIGDGAFILKVLNSIIEEQKMMVSFLKNISKR
jgi:four helix bundle protein